MGAWGSGPFDNDTAADWCGDLDELPADRRPEAIGSALRAAVGEAVHLEVGGGELAVAAAAVVAAQCPRGEELTSEYAPKEPVQLGPEMDSLRTLAIQALNCVVADDSELAELWADSHDGTWEAGIRNLIRLLT